MRIARIIALAVLVHLVIFCVGGCDKERIVKSVETEHVTEYIQLPPDTVTVTVHDTVFSLDSVNIHTTDTLRIHDTVRTTNTVYVHDTVVTVHNHYDTVRVHDTVVTTLNHYDTVTVVVRDTVIKNQCSPTPIAAIGAMEAKTDPMVIDYINQEFGYDDGWVLYLSPEMLDITQVSANVYDIYAYVDYWTPDWSGFYPFEIGWRLSYKGSGDPADPNSWNMAEPPASTSAHHPGIRSTNRSVTIQEMQR